MEELRGPQSFAGATIETTSDATNNWLTSPFLGPDSMAEVSAHARSDAFNLLTSQTNVTPSIAIVDRVSFESFSRALSSLPRSRPRRSRKPGQTDSDAKSNLNSSTKASPSFSIASAPSELFAPVFTSSSQPSVPDLHQEQSPNRLKLTPNQKVDGEFSDFLGANLTSPVQKSCNAREDASANVNIDEGPDLAGSQSVQSLFTSQIRAPKAPNQARPEPMNSNSLRQPSIIPNVTPLTHETAPTVTSSQLYEGPPDQVVPEQQDEGGEGSESEPDVTSRQHKRKRSLPVNQLTLLPPLDDDDDDFDMFPKPGNDPIEEGSSQSLYSNDKEATPAPTPAPSDSKGPRKAIRCTRFARRPPKPPLDLSLFRFPKRADNIPQSRKASAIADGFVGAERYIPARIPRRRQPRAKRPPANTLVFVTGALPEPRFESGEVKGRRVFGITGSTAVEILPREESTNQSTLRMHKNNAPLKGTESTQSRDVTFQAKKLVQVQEQRLELFENGARTVDGEVDRNLSEDRGREYETAYDGDDDEEITDEEQLVGDEAGQLSGEDSQEEDDESERSDDETHGDGSEAEIVMAEAHMDIADAETEDEGLEDVAHQHVVEDSQQPRHGGSSASTWNGILSPIFNIGESSIVPASLEEPWKASRVIPLPEGLQRISRSPNSHINQLHGLIEKPTLAHEKAKKPNPHPADRDEMLSRPGQLNRMRSSHQWLEVNDQIEDDGPSGEYQYTFQKKGDPIFSSSMIPRQQTFQAAEESLAALTLDSGDYFANAARQLSSMPHDRPTSLQSSRTLQVPTAQYDEEEDDVLMDLDGSRVQSLAPKSCRLSPLSRTNMRSHSTVSLVKALSSLASNTNALYATTSGNARRTPSLPFNPPFLKEKDRSDAHLQESET